LGLFGCSCGVDGHGDRLALVGYWDLDSVLRERLLGGRLWLGRVLHDSGVVHFDHVRLAGDFVNPGVVEGGS
jgi:hypothetical protein